MPRDTEDVTRAIDAALLARAEKDLAKIRDNEGDEVPASMFTVQQWAKAWDVKRSQAAERLAALVSDGGWERNAYRVRRTNGVRPVNHFGPK